MSNTKTFRRIGGLNPGRSVFDLSYEKKFTCDMGQLIPIFCDEVVPGDVFTIGSEVLVRAMPLIAPIMHQINVFTHWFFVPYRLLWEDWEEFITGGKDGQVDIPLPRWPVRITMPNATYPTNEIGSLWDYMGFPVGSDCAGVEPMDFPRRAYNFVWNEYYRDQNLEDEIDIHQNPVNAHIDEYKIRIRHWEKDYFTSALPWQQRGIAPALPISGVTNAIFNGPIMNSPPGDPQVTLINRSIGMSAATMVGSEATGSQGTNILRNWFNNNTVDFANAATFNVADLRLAFQIQLWMERNARAGVRYKEFLLSHFGMTVADDRLDRPEYIGGSRNPIIVSEVLQTSESQTTPQGNMAGHGITVGGTRIGTKRVEEFGLIIGIMSIMPRPDYMQGVDRQWLRETRYDFYFPEFANLSEQAIWQGELIAGNDPVENKRIFGWQGRYDEMRFKRNMICGLMRTDFAHWHLGRVFDSNHPPRLNPEFLQCVPDKRIFEVPSEPGFVVTAGNMVRAVRPMPVQSNPGLIDHSYG